MQVLLYLHLSLEQNFTIIASKRDILTLILILHRIPRHLDDSRPKSSQRIRSQCSLKKTGRCNIFNTDQGSQFTSHGFVNLLKAAEIKISMDGKGRALDNIFVERLWRSVKYECVYLQEWYTMKEAINALREYFNFYNYNRPHQSLGGLTPYSVYCGN